MVSIEEFVAKKESDIPQINNYIYHSLLLLIQFVSIVVIVLVIIITLLL
jgi:hypothetical protein